MKKRKERKKERKKERNICYETKKGRKQDKVDKNL